MNIIVKLIKTSRLICVTLNSINKNCHKVPCSRSKIAEVMAQRSITSFFKVTPPKTVVKQEKTETNGSESKEESNGPSSSISKEKVIERKRLDSSDSDSIEPSTVKRRVKRQRLESSSSDSHTGSQKSDEEITTERKKNDIKTYESPKSKKVKLKKVLTQLNKSDADNGLFPKTTSPNKDKDKGLKENDVMKNFIVKKEPVTVNKEKEDNKEVSSKVAESEYNPSKSKYNPISDACWSEGAEVPYLALAKTLEVIEATSARLKIIEILSNYFRSVIALTPDDLLPSVYMCLNQLAPAYHSLELGIAETYLMKAIGQCTGRSLQQVRAAAHRLGDLGAVAEQARAAQRTMFAAPPLKLRRVFAALKDIAHMTGQASVNKKINKIQSLYVACRQCEAKYLIRSLEGKLRIGLAEQSVLQALALATAATPPPRPPSPGAVRTLDASEGLSPETFKCRVDENSLIIKTTYCECPNYELLIPVLLQHGVRALPEHCRLTPGVPLKPMLAHPTRGVHEVFNRFENEQFTCEWKYDGERAQIHVPPTPPDPHGNLAPDLDSVAIFSRNQENNTTKYPDVVGRVGRLLGRDVTSCVLDCEAVAYDTTNRQILPFQILSTRKRKDAQLEDIKVQVCVFVFDLLYLNGEPLVREPLQRRRELLRAHFNQHEGEWMFATSKDCSSIEEVQQFLEEAVKGSCEGLMVKTLSGEHAKYDIARRSRNWLKLKKDYVEGVGDTIDAVVIGAYRGKGKRAGHYGGFLLACYDPHSDHYQSLCKLGTGFSDDALATLTRLLDQHVIDAPKPYYSYESSQAADVWLSAHCVWEVRCADLSLSPVHHAARALLDPDRGISLRFPRFVRVRDDKTPEQATSPHQLVDMYLAQDQVKNQTGKPQHNDDDFY